MFLKFSNADLLEAQIAVAGGGLMKSAHKAVFNYEPREGYLYVRSRAISNRTNDNYDTWPDDELRQAWSTFIGKPVFVNHHNDDVRRKRGVIIDAALHEDIGPDGRPDIWIEVLMEIDAIRFPRLAEAILNHDIERTSMGADVGESECSYCGNVATTPSTYCAHIKSFKGRRLARRNPDGTEEEVLVHEICIAQGEMVSTLRGLVPIEGVVVGDMALTRAGWRRVTDARQTGVRPTVKITLSDGTTLRCTEDHLIATAAGWTPAVSLLVGDVDAEATVSVRALAGVHVGVLDGELVTSLAVGLEGVAVVESVGDGVNRSEMARVDAVALSADVVDFDPLEIMPEKVHHSSVNQSFVVRVATDAPVPIGGSRALPDHALVLDNSPGEQSFQFVQAVCVSHDATVPVYDLTVDGEHEFVANGIVVHNCRKISFFENSVLVEPPADPTAFFLGVDDRGVRSLGMEAKVAKISDDAYVELTEEQKDRFAGTTVRQDGDGFYCHTHRARGKSYPSIDEIPDDEVGFIESTGSAAPFETEVQQEMTKMANRKKDRWRTMAKAASVTKEGVTQEESERLLDGLDEKYRSALEKFVPYTVYGPTYSRGITTNLMDAIRAARQRNDASFNYLWSKCEAGYDIEIMGGEDNWYYDSAMGQYTKRLATTAGALDYGPMAPGRDAGTRWEGIASLPNSRAYKVVVLWPGDEAPLLSGVFDSEERAREWAQKCVEAGGRNVLIENAGTFTRVSKTAATQAEADQLLSGLDAEHRQALEKFVPYTVYGPGYNRSIASNLADAIMFAKRGEERSYLLAWSKCEAALDIATTGEDNWYYDSSMGQYTKRLASKPETMTWDEYGQHGEEKPELITWDEWEMAGSTNYGLGYSAGSSKIITLSEALDWGVPTDVESFTRGFQDAQAGRPKTASTKLAWGETKAPPQVNTLGLTECPVCATTNQFDSTGRCMTCGHLPAPDPFREPDLEVAQKVDMRDGWVNPNLLSAPAFVPPAEGEAGGGENSQEARDPVQKESSATEVVEGLEGDTMRPAAAIIASQEQQIARLSAENAVLRRRAGLVRTADEENPAQPVPEPAAQAPAQSTDEARAADATTEVTTPGSALTDVAPMTTTDVTTPGAAATDVAPDATQDVTAPVAGGAEMPSYEQSVTLVQPDASGASNGTDRTNAFDEDNSWVQQANAVRARVYATIRLAKLRIQAGLADGDDLVVAQQIEASRPSDDALRTEISTLSAVVQQRVASAAPRRREAARTAPSLASSGSPIVSTGSTSSFEADPVLW